MSTYKHVSSVEPEASNQGLQRAHTTYSSHTKLVIAVVLHCMTLYFIAFHYHYIQCQCSYNCITLRYSTVYVLHYIRTCACLIRQIRYIHICGYIRQKPPRVFAVQSQRTIPEPEPCPYKHKIEKKDPKTQTIVDFVEPPPSQVDCIPPKLPRRRPADRQTNNLTYTPACVRCKQQAVIHIRIHMRTHTHTHAGPHSQTHTLTHIFTCVHMALFTVPKSRQQSGHPPIRAQDKDLTQGLRASALGATLAGFGTLDSALEL